MQTPYSVQATSQGVCIVLAQNADNLATADIERATRDGGRRRAKVSALCLRREASPLGHKMQTIWRPLTPRVQREMKAGDEPRCLH